MESSLKLRPQTVFSSVLEGGKTFEEMAPSYGMDTERFREAVRAKVGQKDFDRLQKTSERNKKKQEQKLSQARKNSGKSKAVETEQEDNDMAKKNQQGNTVEQEMTERDRLNAKKTDAEREVTALTTLLQSKEALLEGSLEDKKKAEDAVMLAQDSLKKAQNAFKKAQSGVASWQSEVNEVKRNLAEWQECLQHIESQIADLDNKVIYLVAPGYHGEHPKAGQLLSVVPFEGATIASGEELFKEPTAMDLLDSGFELITEAKNAYNFARLVIKYLCAEGMEVKVLVDDERVTRILRDQGLEF